MARNTKKVIALLKQLMDKYETKDQKWINKYGTNFADVKIYTDKDMQYEHNDDESKGWTGTLSSLKSKEKNSNVVILVTYDGAGHEYFTYDSSLNLTEKFQEILDNEFGEGTYHIEHNTSWSFSVYYEGDLKNVS